MDSRVIRNCWCHTKVVGENVDVNGEMVMHRDLFSFITGPEEDSGITEEGGDEEVVVPPLREQLRILASAHVIMSNYNASGAVLRGLAKVQRGLRCQVQEEFCQT